MLLCNGCACAGFVNDQSYFLSEGYNNLAVKYHRKLLHVSLEMSSQYAEGKFSLYELRIYT